MRKPTRPGKTLVAAMAAWLLLSGAAAFAGVTSPFAIDHLNEQIEGTLPEGAGGEIKGGEVDWTGGWITATAIGTADMRRMVNEVQAEQVARRTARHLAMVALAESLNQVKIDSRTLYKQSIEVDGRIIVRMKAVLKNAQVLDKDFMWTDRGSPRAEYTVGVRLFGGKEKGWTNFIEATAPKVEPPPKNPAVREKAPPTKKKQPIAPPKKKATPAEKVSAPPPVIYTGLIVDARGTDLEPVLKPRILIDNQLSEVFGPSSVDISIAINMGYVGYAYSPGEAHVSERTGPKPLTVKALSAHGRLNGDALVTAADAMKILAADEKSHFLNKCKVVFVLRKR